MQLVPLAAAQAEGTRAKERNSDDIAEDIQQQKINECAMSEESSIEEAPLMVLVTTYLWYLILIIFGHVRDFFGKLFKRAKYAHLKVNDVSGYRGVIRPA